MSLGVLLIIEVPEKNAYCALHNYVLWISLLTTAEQWSAVSLEMFTGALVAIHLTLTFKMWVYLAHDHAQHTIRHATHLKFGHGRLNDSVVALFAVITSIKYGGLSKPLLRFGIGQLHDDAIKWKHFPVTCLLCDEAKARDAELWCFLWSATE